MVSDLSVQQGTKLASLSELSLSPLPVPVSVAEIFCTEAAFICSVGYYKQAFLVFNCVTPLQSSHKPHWHVDPNLSLQADLVVLILDCKPHLDQGHRLGKEKERKKISHVLLHYQGLLVTVSKSILTVSKKANWHKKTSLVAQVLAHKHHTHPCPSSCLWGAPSNIYKITIIFSQNT